MSEVILLDGGMGQELIHRSKHKPHPLWSAKVLLDEPELVEQVHYEFISAGATVITLNNYSCTPERLERDGSLDMFEKLHSKAISVAKRARDRSKVSHSVRLAGSLPPLYASYRPDVTPSLEDCITSYERIAEVQVDEVDILMCETMSSVKELQASGHVASQSGKTAWVSGSVSDSNGLLLRSGEELEEGLASLAKLDIDAVLVNCSFPESITDALKMLSTLNVPYGGYANRFKSIDKLNPGGTVDVLQTRDDLDEERYAKVLCDWVNMGATIVGGCCEIGPEYIRTIKDALIENGHKIVSELK